MIARLAPLALALSLPALASVPASSANPLATEPEAELRLYDLTELGTLMPSSSPADASIMIVTMSEMLGLDARQVSRAMVTVLAQPSEHAQIGALVEQIAAPYKTRYSVQIVAMSLPADKPVAVGQTVSSIDPDATQLILTTRSRTSTPFQATQTTAYIAGWQPVVSAGSVGYEPKIDSIDLGLHGELILVPDEQGVTIRLAGELSNGHINYHDQPLQSPGSFMIGLPAFSTRSVAVDQSLELGALTAVNIVEGFEAGSTLVIAVRADRLP